MGQVCLAKDTKLERFPDYWGDGEIDGERVDEARALSSRPLAPARFATR